MCNDDHNTFDHVARTLARFIPGISLQRGHEIALMDLVDPAQAVTLDDRLAAAKFLKEHASIRPVNSRRAHHRRTGKQRRPFRLA